MAIKIIHDGDIFNSPLATITNTVNCVGVMGKGLALQFKKRYPALFEDYARRCRLGEVRPGEPYLYEDKRVSVLNFPTKLHWKNPSRIEWVDQGLIYLRNHYMLMGIKELALPPLGCGCGGLDWDVVARLMIERFSSLPIPIEIYAPALGGGKND